MRTALFVMALRNNCSVASATLRFDWTLRMAHLRATFEVVATTSAANDALGRDGISLQIQRGRIQFGLQVLWTRLEIRLSWLGLRIGLRLEWG